MGCLVEGFCVSVWNAVGSATGCTDQDSREGGWSMNGLF